VGLLYWRGVHCSNVRGGGGIIIPERFALQ
jgi:hypothetical protein